MPGVGESNGTSRRAFLAAAGLTAAALAGCSSETAGKGRPAGADGGLGTKVVDSSRGEIVVPASPQRVVCAHHYPLQSLLDVGVTPVGTSTVGDTSGWLPEAVGAYQAVPKIGPSAEIDYAAVAALEPDLIFAVEPADKSPALFEQLNAIAPTVMYDVVTAGDWPDLAVNYAAAAGRRTEADKLKKEYDDRAAELKAKYPDQLAATTWSLVAGGDNAFVIYQRRSWAGVVLSAAGATFSAGSATDTTGASAGYDRLDKLADAGVVITPCGQDGSTPAPTQALFGQPGWPSVPAVAAGHAFPVPNFYASHFTQGLALLDDLDAILAKL